MCIRDSPYAVKIMNQDTAYISAEKFLSYQKPDSTNKKKSFLRGYKKVRMYMTKAQGRADSPVSYTHLDVYKRQNDFLLSVKQKVTLSIYLSLIHI